MTLVTIELSGFVVVVAGAELRLTFSLFQDDFRPAWSIVHISTAHSPQRQLNSTLMHDGTVAGERCVLLCAEQLTIGCYSHCTKTRPCDYGVKLSCRCVLRIAGATLVKWHSHEDSNLLTSNPLFNVVGLEDR